MKARIVWLILCGIWGSTWLFIKLGLVDLPPLSFAGIRFVFASLILTLLIFARRVRWPRSQRDWLLIAIVGFLQFTLNYGLVFWGEQYISSGLAAVLQSTFPLFGLVIAHLYLPHERMTVPKVIGVSLGVLGVAIIFSHQLTIAGRVALLGSIALVLSALFGSYSNVLVKAYGRQIDPLVLAAGQMVCGFPPLLALGNMDVTKTMLIALVTPVVAVLLGVAVLHESLNWRLLAGAACIVSGIGLIVFRKRQKNVSTPAGDAALVRNA